MTTEEKFNAAVNVIKSLPKNGVYQPSNELMLKFYCYFKQATEGPCKSPKPAFWEVVKKAKWDAWSRLGNMSRDEAMKRYVEELKKVVDTMCNMDNVADYADELDAFNKNVSVKDLELVVGPVLEKIRSQSNSPIPDSFMDSTSRRENGEPPPPPNIVNSFKTNGECLDDFNAYSAETETEDEFIDTVESTPAIIHKKFSKSHVKDDHNAEHHNNSKHDLDYLLVNNDDKNFTNQIALTLKSLQKDLETVMIRITNIEQQVLLLTKNQVNTKQNHNSNNNSVFRWPLPKNPSQLLVLIILWPFVAQFCVFLIKRCHRRKV